MSSQGGFSKKSIHQQQNESCQKFARRVCFWQLSLLLWIEGKISKMDFAQYQQLSGSYTETPGTDDVFMYSVLGLNGEAGEVAEVVKKMIRDKGKKLSEEDKQDLLKELGDILWYLSKVASKLEFSLEDVANANLLKLKERYGDKRVID